MSDAYNPFDTSSDDANELKYAEVKQITPLSWAAHDATVNTTFESDIFQFSATSTVTMNASETPRLFPDDPMAGPANLQQNTVHVALHEQLTSLYEGNESIPTTQIEGSIHVRSSSSTPFELVVRDPNKHMESFRADPKFCVKAENCDGNAVLGDKVLQIVVPSNSAKKQKIATYVCSGHLRPIPLLVKSKILVEENRCRVGVKIRSNPANRQPLTKLAILMAVPPDIRGETVKLTRQGGVWDGMKRVVAWPVEVLTPGELIEIQAQFDFVSPDESQRFNPKFPVLVRCEAADDQFSTIELKAQVSDDTQIPVHMSLTRSVRILHRKV